MLIKSPLKGVVISKDVEVGEWVTTGGQVAGVATLTYEAKVYIPESVLPYIKAGQQVVVRTSRKEYTGKVKFLISSTRCSSGTQQCKGRI